MSPTAAGESWAPVTPGVSVLMLPRFTRSPHAFRALSGPGTSKKKSVAVPQGHHCSESRGFALHDKKIEGWVLFEGFFPLFPRATGASNGSASCSRKPPPLSKRQLLAETTAPSLRYWRWKKRPSAIILAMQHPPPIILTMTYWRWKKRLPLVIQRRHRMKTHRTEPADRRRGTCPGESSRR